MIVHVNGRYYSKARFTGTQRSSHNLLRSVAAASPKLRFVVHLSPVNPVWEELKTHPNIEIRANLPASTAKLHLWEQFRFPRIDPGSLHLSLVGTAPFLWNTHDQVMVVHDIHYRLLPGLFSLPYRLQARGNKVIAARRARRVVCFSHYVASTLREHLGLPADRISVIHQGPGIPAAVLEPASRVRQPQPKPYFLCVGSLQPHKNLPRLLAAWSSIEDQLPDHRLCVIGQAQPQFAPVDYQEQLARCRRVEFTGYVSDAQLAELYRNATALVYPSIEEGFGLPIVEAFIAGCPVITSNRSCMPEIGGSAALYANPEDPAEIAQRMLSVGSDPALATQLRDAGFLRARDFTWPAAGTALRDVLTSMTTPLQ